MLGTVRLRKVFCISKSATCGCGCQDTCWFRKKNSNVNSHRKRMWIAGTYSESVSCYVTSLVSDTPRSPPSPPLHHDLLYSSEVLNEVHVLFLSPLDETLKLR